MTKDLIRVLWEVVDTELERSVSCEIMNGSTMVQDLIRVLNAHTGLHSPVPCDLMNGGYTMAQDLIRVLLLVDAHTGLDRSVTCDLMNGSTMMQDLTHVLNAHSDLNGPHPCEDMNGDATLIPIALHKLWKEIETYNMSHLASAHVAHCQHVMNTR